MHWRSIRSRSGQWLFRGHSFSEPPTETVGRRPCSHGGGPLRELDGQCPPSPIAGSPVPCSAPSGALRRNTKGMRAPIGPLRIGFRPPPLAPAKGGRWLRTAAAPGLRPAASRHHSAGDPGPRLRWPRAIAACARPSLRRRLGPPLASLRPAGGSDGSGTRSCGSPLGCFGWACGPPSAPLRVRLRPFCAPSQWVPPGRPRPRPALPRPSVGWSPGWAAGSAPPAWGLERPCGPLLYGPGPRRREQMQSGACLWILAGASRAAPSGFVSAVSADSISIYRKSFCKL